MLIFPANYPTGLANTQWEHLNRSRAIDNDEQNEYVQHGNSMMVDYRGQVVARSGDQEELVFCKLNMDEQNMFRDQVTLFKHKRIDVYETKNMKH